MFAEGLIAKPDSDCVASAFTTSFTDASIVSMTIVVDSFFLRAMTVLADSTIGVLLLLPAPILKAEYALVADDEVITSKMKEDSLIYLMNQNFCWEMGNECRTHFSFL